MNSGTTNQQQQQQHPHFKQDQQQCLPEQQQQHDHPLHEDHKGINFGHTNEAYVGDEKNDSVINDKSNDDSDSSCNKNTYINNDDNISNSNKEIVENKYSITNQSSCETDDDANTKNDCCAISLKDGTNRTNDNICNENNINEGSNNEIYSSDLNSSDNTDAVINPSKGKDGLQLRNQIIGALAGSLIHFALGAVVGLSGVILPSLVDPSNGDIVLDSQQASLFSSLLYIGSMIGSLVSGPLSVWLGQRATLLSVIPIAAAGWLLQALTPNIWLLQCARFVLGIIVGIYGGPGVTYVAEITHSSVRGRLAGLVDLFRQFGLLFVYVVGSTNLGWRHSSILCGLVTTVIPFVFLYYLPNSPRWLATKSRFKEARHSLKFYRGNDYDIDHEIDDICKQLKESSQGSNVTEQFKYLKNPSVLKRMVLLIYLFFSYQFTGSLTMIVFSTTIFQSIQGNVDEYTSTIIIGSVRVLSTITYILLADRVGRRILFIGSLAVAGISMAFVGLSFYIETQNDITSVVFKWFPLISMAVFMFFTSIAESPMMLLRSELLPTSVRALGVSIVYMFFFAGAFLAAFLFPLMVSSIGSHGTFWIYAADAILMAVVGTLFIPETSSKSLEAIQHIYVPEDHDRYSECNRKEKVSA